MMYYVYWFIDDSGGLLECNTLEEVSDFIKHEEIDGYVLIKGDLIQKKGVDNEKIH